MTAPCICPTCGQEMTAPDRVEFYENIAFLGDATVRISPQQQVLLRLLDKVWPEAAHQDRIMGALYNGTNDPPDLTPAETIGVRVCLLKKRIKPLGLTVENVWGFGYRLVYPEVA